MGDTGTLSAACSKAILPIHKSRAGQNRIHTPYLTVNLMVSMPKLPCIHRINEVLAKPN